MGKGFHEIAKYQNAFSFPQWLHGYGTGVIVLGKTDHMCPLPPFLPILSDPLTTPTGKQG